MELLAPAGDEKCLEAALNGGADAVYLGLSNFSARASAENFDIANLSATIKRAHIAGARVYVAMNTLVKDSETAGFIYDLLSAYNAGADAIIMQDIFLGGYIHSLYPEITLHLSTQAGACNVYAARLAKEEGFARVILSRETPIGEIKKITQIIETEVFIQGALCSCFSGQCYLSGFAGGNSGNRGRCKQPCRKRYSYSRAGFTDMAYALSLADLCVGQDISALIAAGVHSFKIEGRMRRPEYVAAALKYYKALLSGGDGKDELSALKRTFNRGNYTRGLAFGQDKRFISRDVQGHMGEKVGVISVRNKRYYVESKSAFKKGDCFKILRSGKEVGGATFAEGDKRGFYINSGARLANGDGVFITTDTAISERLLSERRRRKISAEVTLAAGERACARIPALGVCVYGEEPLAPALTRPVTRDEVASCFEKSELFEVELTVHIDGAFIVKSALNALRRAFFAAAEEALGGLPAVKYSPVALEGPNFAPPVKRRKAVIAAYAVKADILIFKPSDYAADFSALAEYTGEKYLYLPAFMTSGELALVDDKLSLFDGVYCEGAWGLVYAREKGKKLFAGTGFNLTNFISVGRVKAIAQYYALSKELSLSEQRPLSAENSFVLTAGDIKVMDLIYCPFGKSCSSCDKANLYALTDENARKFPVRRYVVSACRFEVFNCARLVSSLSFGGALYDFSATEKRAALAALDCDDVKELKQVLAPHTSGHSESGVI